MLQPATAAEPAAMNPISGHYRAVTESEWALEVELGDNGVAAYRFSSWEAGNAASTTKTEVISGRWISEGGLVLVEFPELGGGKWIRYQVVACLSYGEFGMKGCSPGLKTLTNTMDRRFGMSLWDARTFKTP